MRVWIEGESAGQPFVRRSDLAGPARLVRGRPSGPPTCPAGGLDRVRLRFELLTPGQLWVDDLASRGDGLSEPERLNARSGPARGPAGLPREALRRLRPPGRLALGAAVDADAGADGRPADRAGVIRTGDASALPPGRRLR